MKKLLAIALVGALVYTAYKVGEKNGQKKLKS